LLKTLEEPPPQVVLILTALDAEALLPTIVSRCELLRLRPLPLAQLSQALQDRCNLDKDRAELLAHVSGGRPGYALRLYDDPQSLEDRDTWLVDLLDLLKSSRLKRFAYVESLVKDRPDLDRQLQVWASFWRDILLVSASGDVPLTNIDRVEEITSLAASLDRSYAKMQLQVVERTRILLAQYVNARLVLENLMLAMNPDS
jgi:DNA polymerase-3 subunit delta'